MLKFIKDFWECFSTIIILALAMLTPIVIPTLCAIIIGNYFGLPEEGKFAIWIVVFAVVFSLGYAIHEHRK